MGRDEYKKYLRMLGEELQKQEVTGEILVADDVVVILDVRQPKVQRDIEAYLAGDDNAISIPRDIDAYFGGHGMTTRQAITSLADREKLPLSWFDDALKELFSKAASEEWLEYPGLRIYIPVLEHSLAMLVATSDGLQNIDGIKKLANRLHITTTRALQACVVKYISRKLLTPAMSLVIKEALKKDKKRVKVRIGE